MWKVCKAARDENRVNARSECFKLLRIYGIEARLTDFVIT